MRDLNKDVIIIAENIVFYKETWKAIRKKALYRSFPTKILIILMRPDTAGWYWGCSLHSAGGRKGSRIDRLVCL